MIKLNDEMRAYMEQRGRTDLVLYTICSHT